MNNPNCGACGMLNSRGFCSLTACRFPVVNELGTWQERILANKPKHTNADRIRAMSDEELAKQLCKGSCPPDKYKFHCTKIFSGGTTECEKCWLDYLTQEVTEDACL